MAGSASGGQDSLKSPSNAPNFAENPSIASAATQFGAQLLGGPQWPLLGGNGSILVDVWLERVGPYAITVGSGVKHVGHHVG
jgi:hypothetical protein